MRTPEMLRIDDAVASTAPVRYERIGYSWGAVAAGVAIAIALTVWFAEIGLALNLAIIDTTSDAGTVGLVNGVLWVVTGLVALFAGTWVAGRMSQSRTAMEGGLHGVGVWAASSIATLMLAFGAAGAVAGGALSVVNTGLSSAGEAVTAVAPDWDTIREQLDQAKDQVVGEEGNAAQAVEAVANDTRFRDESRLLQLAGEHFSLDGSQLTTQERAEFTNLVASRLQISEEAAQETLAQWDRAWESGVARFEAAQARAVEIADQTRNVAVAAAGWAALSMLLGLVVAAFGGAFGAVCRVRAERNEYVLAAGRPIPSSSSAITHEASRAQLDAERRDAALRARTGTTADTTQKR